MSRLDNYECEGQISMFETSNVDGWSGKTSREPIQATKEQISKQCSPKSSESQSQTHLMCLCLRKTNGHTQENCTMRWEHGVLPGELTVQASGECPNAENEYLWSLTEGGVLAGKILFDEHFGEDSGQEIRPISESLPGHTEQSKPQREEASGGFRESSDPTSISFQERAGKPGGGKGILIQNERTGTLGTQNVQSVFSAETWHLNAEKEISPTLKARDYKDPNIVNQTIAVDQGGGEPVVYGISSYESNSMKSSNPNSGIYKAETSRTLDNNGGNPACNQGGLMVLEGNGSRPSHLGDGYKESEIMYTLNATEQHAVCFENHLSDARYNPLGDTCSTLTSRLGTGGNNQPLVVDNSNNMVCHANGNSVDNEIAPTIVGDHQNRITDFTSITYQDTTGPLMASGYNKLGTQEAANDMYVVQENWDGSQTSPTLTANNAGGEQRMPDKQNFNAVVTYGLDRASFNQGKNAKYDFQIDEEKIGTCVARGPGAVAVDCRNGIESEVNASLQASANHNLNSNNVCRTYQDITGTLDCCINKGTSNQLATSDMFVTKSTVRRLTPMECERLQAFPDGWTDIGEWVDSKGKKHKDADSPRYKALGNSIALPFWFYLLKRISATYEKDYTPTLGSLFDGIGGFPLCWERINGKGTARWASEIEEFCIAVTKKRFLDESNGESL